MERQNLIMIVTMLLSGYVASGGSGKLAHSEAKIGETFDTAEKILKELERRRPRQ